MVHHLVETYQLAGNSEPVKVRARLKTTDPIWSVHLTMAGPPLIMSGSI
jgi:hypothetical protein